MNVNGKMIRDLVADGHLEDAIAVFRDTSRVRGGALRARLFLLERQRSQGTISDADYATLVERLAADLLDALDECEKETGS